MNAFCEILRSLRCEKGISQRYAAEDLGISQALLSHYENGAREPKLDFIHRVCDYYGVSADYLLGRGKKRAPQTLSAPRCEKKGKAFSVAYQSVMDALDRHHDPALCSAAVDYLLVPTENLASMLDDPNKLYDPLHDARMKLAEAAFISLLRK